LTGGRQLLGKETERKKERKYPGGGKKRKFFSRGARPSTQELTFPRGRGKLKEKKGGG